MVSSKPNLLFFVVIIFLFFPAIKTNGDPPPQKYSQKSIDYQVTEKNSPQKKRYSAKRRNHSDEIYQIENYKPPAIQTFDDS